MSTDIVPEAKSAAVADLAERINEAHGRAVEHAGKALDHALECGRMLLEAKRAIPHGGWLPWLRENVSFSERTAQAYMRLAERPAAIERMRAEGENLSVRDALKKLATPRVHSLMDELAEYVERAEAGRAARPANVSDWTAEDAKACAASIRGFDELMHRHGLCPGDECCVVCGDDDPEPAA